MFMLICEIIMEVRPWLTTTPKQEQSDKRKLTAEDKEGKETRYQLTFENAGKQKK